MAFPRDLRRGRPSAARHAGHHNPMRPAFQVGCAKAVTACGIAVYSAAIRPPGNATSTRVPVLTALLILKLRAVGLGQRLGQRQAEAGAARAPARRGRELAERLQRHRDVLLAHADAGVAHAQHHLAVVAARGRDDHLAADAGELDRVGQAG